MFFVTSWDDGHPLDERIAELLNRFAMKGTFFVPIRNREGHPVMSGGTLRRLGARFEIGSHTLDHVPLTEVPQKECVRQVFEGKARLEQELGRSVGGFCYPRGKWNEQVRRAVVDAGFSYARTIENLRVDLGEDPFAIPTSIQVFSHAKQVFIRNFLRYGYYSKKYQILWTALKSQNWSDFCVELIDRLLDTNIVLHLWGHSWEIDEHQLWQELEKLLSIIASISPIVCTVGELEIGSYIGTRSNLNP